MIKCKHCDFTCDDGQVPLFIEHMYDSHEDIVSTDGFRLGDHGECTTKPKYPDVGTVCYISKDCPSNSGYFLLVDGEA